MNLIRVMDNNFSRLRVRRPALGFTLINAEDTFHICYLECVYCIRNSNSADKSSIYYLERKFDTNKMK